MIKVIFKDESFWNSSEGECSYNVEMYSLYKIDGVDDPEQCRKYEHELRGSRFSKIDCLISVFWDLVTDQSKYEDFYDMCASFYDIGDLEIRSMLLDKGIEVVFLED